MENERVEKIKRDLKSLKRLTHAIDGLLLARERHERRIEYLEAADGISQAVRDAEIKRLRSIICELDATGVMAHADELELTYGALMRSLEPIDRAILTEAYINGRTYREVGRIVGYSERGIQNRVSMAVRKLAEMI